MSWPGRLRQDANSWPGHPISDVWVRTSWPGLATFVSYCTSAPSLIHTCLLDYNDLDISHYCFRCASRTTSATIRELARLHHFRYSSSDTLLHFPTLGQEVRTITQCSQYMGKWDWFWGYSPWNCQMLWFKTEMTFWSFVYILMGICKQGRWGRSPGQNPKMGQSTFYADTHYKFNSDLFVTL